MIEPGQQNDGMFNFSDLLPTVLGLAGETSRLPADRYIDGIDQSAFLLAPQGLSHRKYHYYWLMQNFSALRCGEYKLMLRSTSDEGGGHAGPGGFTGILQQHTYPALYNLYLDPKETHNYMTRKLAYMEAFQLGIRQHLASFKRFPPKQVMGLAAADPRAK